jgi:hypothetical protein
VTLSPDGVHIFVSVNTQKTLAVLSVCDVAGGGATCDPTYVAEIAGMDSPRELALSSSGQYAYVAAANSNAMMIINVKTTPTAPTLVGTYTSSTDIGGARGVAVSPSGTYAYVTGWSSNRLVVIDISTPSAPTRKGFYSSTTYLDQPYVRVGATV